jgi:hypothetical protein
VNHVEAHLVSPAIEHDLPYPFVGMVASGGHTEIYHVAERARIGRLGSTRDDAAARRSTRWGSSWVFRIREDPRSIGLAREGNADAIPFPVARLGNETYDVSMSGLKTAVKLLVEKEPKPIPDARVRDIAASAERAIVVALAERLALTLDRHPARALGLAGGCACNTLLRAGGDATSPRRWNPGALPLAAPLPRQRRHDRLRRLAGPVPRPFHATRRLRRSKPGRLFRRPSKTISNHKSYRLTPRLRSPRQPANRSRSAPPGPINPNSEAKFQEVPDCRTSTTSRAVLRPDSSNTFACRGRRSRRHRERTTRNDS